MSLNKKNVTFSIDKKVKINFQSEVVLNGSDMSTVVEGLMTGYINASVSLRSKLK